MTTIGFIGAGHIGSTLARAFVDHGHDVVLSNSRGPQTLSDLVAELGPHARAATPSEAAEAADIAVVTIPLKAIDSVPVEPLAGKIVIDTNNYYPQRDGQIPALDDESTTTSELLQAHLPTSKVVKAFNHIMFRHILEHASPAGTANRRALAAVSNDAQAAATVAGLIDELGFDPVVVTPLSQGWRIQRDTPGYVTPRTAAELRTDLANAKRYRDM
ncbi:MAG: NADPH-dependent F420 reductase [Propionicimonas sp.]|uniref:NADPH-dependent F420 reductase n=1 Tax=Propionicimonas sp. TaxID=1955623 RepID=UPI002B1F1F48|nr:NADPH-dependent F420 reductase [Propionicimonas sp.]MEA4944540.1 NADPH-dependent F420 reductase [Propionicimonas sp.]MEA5118924.1 NADPH-dependent F420 reductase [Propionicimonas sp.]